MIWTWGWDTLRYFASFKNQTYFQLHENCIRLPHLNLCTQNRKHHRLKCCRIVMVHDGLYLYWLETWANNIQFQTLVQFYAQFTLVGRLRSKWKIYPQISQHKSQKEIFNQNIFVNEGESGNVNKSFVLLQKSITKSSGSLTQQKLSGAPQLLLLAEKVLQWKNVLTTAR